MTVQTTYVDDNIDSDAWSPVGRACGKGRAISNEELSSPGCQNNRTFQESSLEDGHQVVRRKIVRNISRGLFEGVLTSTEYCVLLNGPAALSGP